MEQALDKLALERAQQRPIQRIPAGTSYVILASFRSLGQDFPI